MREYSFTDLNRSSGKILDEAMIEPVKLKKNGIDKLVLMSASQYRALTDAYGFKAYTIENAPDEVDHALSDALSAVLDD